MGKVRCANCGKKIDSDFEYCPSCGCRVQRDAVKERKSHLGGCAVVVALLIICCSVAATVWLVREHDTEEAHRLEMKHREDSLKAVAMAQERRARERADSARQVADSTAHARELLSKLVEASDLFRFESGEDVPHLESIENIVTALRERGYSTLRKMTGEEGTQTVMGLNATLSGTKVAAGGSVFSVVSVWPSKIEIMFCSDDAMTDFLIESRSLGFTDDGNSRLVYMAESGPKIRRIRQRVLEITRR